MEHDAILIKEMFKLQDSFNEYTTRNWKDADLNWSRAIWLECAEALDSLDWKWWKHKEPDMDNLKVELVDIWHFIMSYLIVNHPEMAEHPEEQPMFDPMFNGDIPLMTMIEDLSSLALEQNNPDKRYMAFIFMTMWRSLGYNTTDLYRDYIVKNSLNKFRQDNGYKTGEYRKIRDFRGNEVEDNVIAYILADEIGVAEGLFEELYKALKEQY